MESKVLAVFSSDLSFNGTSILTVGEAEDEIDESKPVSIFSIAKKYGLKDLYIAEKSCSGLVDCYNFAEKLNINLRFGFKVIYCNDINDKSGNSFNTEHKIIVWLNHSDGYKNLVKLVSKAQTDGFYYIPRIDKNVLKEFWSEHLSISIPFYDSFIYKNVIEFGKCIPEFPVKPTFFIENNELPFDKILEAKVREYSLSEKCEIVPAQSIFYYKNSDYKAYCVNKCIANRTFLEKPELPFNSSDKFSFESALNKGVDADDFYQFCKSFSRYSLPFWGIRLPQVEVDNKIKKKIGIKDGSSNFALLKALCKDGFHKRRNAGQIKESEIEWYRNQVSYELKTLKTLGFVDYILIVWDVINFCRENNIPVGRGRGSAAGCSVLYLLGVTDIPVKRHELLFERFLSADRAATIEKNGITYLTDAPDVDCDISREQRFKVINYLNDKYPGQTSKLINITTYQGKVLVKEVAKCVDNCEQSYLNHVTDLIPVEFGNVADIEDVYKNESEFKEFCDKYPETYKIALKLRGLAKNKSVHASGYLVAHCPINEFIPTEVVFDKKGNKHIASSLDMYSAGNIVVKIDLLGLKTLDVLDNCFKLTGIDFNTVDIDDPSIYKYLSNSDAPPMGIFQMEKNLGLKTIRQIKPDNINHVIDSISLGRPGSMRYIPDYCAFKNKEKFPIIDNRVKDILEPTGGLLIFQEQLMRLSVRMANFSPNESNGIRKCVTKDTNFISKTRGFISIQTLLKEGYKNDLFLVMNEIGEQFWKPIKEIWATGKQNTYTIRTKSGLSVNTTRWHQLLTEKGWKAKNYLEVDKDFLVTCKHIDYDGSDLISENLAIIIAGLVCEGYFVRDSNATFTNFEKENMDRFVNSFFKEFGISPKFTLKDYKVARILKKEKLIINKYLKFGLSVSKELPECMMGLTKETTRKFLSFMLTCEGSINDNGFEFNSKSEKLISQVKLLLLRFGIRSSFCIKNNYKYGNFYYLNIQEADSLIKLQIELSCFLESRKQKELMGRAILNKKTNYTVDVIPKYLVEKFKWQYGFGHSRLESSSGTLYNSNISRKRFSFYVERSNNEYWRQLNNGNQEYSVIKSIELNKYEETFDFTVDVDTPYIVANGIVIHNCVGKKDKKKMMSYKDRFLQGSLDGGFSKEYSEDIWQTFENSADYSFNLSHAASYGYLSAITTFYKANYPKEFYISLLKNAEGEGEEITQIQKELQYFDIKLLPPCLLKGNIPFIIEGKNIRFGLNSIKGLAESALQKLNNFKSENCNKFQMFQAAKQAGLSCGVMAALIMSGALDVFVQDSRSTLSFECLLFSKLKDKERLFCIQNGQKYNFQLIEMVKNILDWTDSQGKLVARKTRLNTLRKDTTKYQEIYKNNKDNEDLTRLVYEKALLGFNYSKTLKEVLSKNGRDDIINLQEFKNDVDPNRSAVVVCRINEAKASISRAGNPMMKLFVSDEYETTCFIFAGQSYQDFLVECKNEPHLNENDIVALKLTKAKDGSMGFVQKLKKQGQKIYTKMADIKEATQDTEILQDTSKKPTESQQISMNL